MNSSTACFEPSEVDSFLEGDLTPEELAFAEVHLARCESCRSVIESAIGPKDWWDDVQRSLNPKDDELFSTNELGQSAHEDRTSIDQLLELLGPTDDPAMLGRIGSYEITGILGQGGMGAVFKGFDRSLNRFVAIKVLLPHLATSGAARQRFAREGQAVAAVVNNHVMAIHCVDEWQGVPYLVMTYSRGVSLQKRLGDQGPLELREILRIGMQAARGLAAAHAQGIVHRDVKPANIFLDEHVERVQLMDFGLARAVDDASLTRSGMLAGTPQYMSPEQARAEKVDQRSDLFSLGAVLYAMCVGRAPFHAESSYSILRLITDSEPRPIREINPDIPEWLCQVIGKLMSKRADERYQSANEVAELLESCLAHVQQPTDVPLPSALIPSPKRKPIVSFSRGSLGVIAIVAALGASVFVIALFQWTRVIDSANPPQNADRRQAPAEIQNHHGSENPVTGPLKARETRIYNIGHLPLWTQDGATQNAQLLIQYLKSLDEASWAAGETQAVYSTDLQSLTVSAANSAHEEIAKILSGSLPPFVSPGEAPIPAASEKVVAYSIADLPLWTKDGKFQGVDLLIAYLKLKTGPSLWDEASIRASYFSEGNLLIVATIDAHHKLIKAALNDVLRLSPISGGGSQQQVGSTTLRFTQPTPAIPGQQAAPPTPLEDSVKAFNRELVQNAVGKQLSPLTVDEVVNSVRLATLDGVDLAPPALQEFRDIAEQRRVHDGWHIDLASTLVGDNEKSFTRWSINLTLLRRDSNDRELIHVIRELLIPHVGESGNRTENQLWEEYEVTTGPVSDLTAKVLEWLGLRIRPISREQFRGKDILATYRGGLAVEIRQPDCPADEAGVNHRDIIVSLQGQNLTSLEQLDSEVSVALQQSKQSDTDSLQFIVLRNGETLEVNVPFAGASRELFHVANPDGPRSTAKSE